MLAINKNSSKKDYKIGDVIEFGNYYQDNFYEQKTPIKWRILDVEEGKALLVSELLLDSMNYAPEGKIVTWEKV